MSVATKNKRVGIIEISQSLGLSKTTVAYILNGQYRKVKISPKTAEHVIKTAKKMGYRPNYWAKSLAMNKSKLVGMIFPDLGHSVADQVVRGSQKVLDGSSYQSLLAVYHWDPVREAREIELMLEKQVGCIIALPYAGSSKCYEDAVKSGCRVVFICDYLKGINIPSVVLDPDDSVCKVVRHLYELGHKNIHLLSVDYNASIFQDREKTFQQELCRLGLHFDEESISRSVLGNVSSVNKQVQLLMARKNPPTALFCICDAIAMESLAELDRLGVKVPGQIAVAGLGNVLMADHSFFSLTTVDEKLEEIGRCAAELALRREDAFKSTEHILIKGDLIVRGSTLRQNKEGRYENN